MAEPRPNCSEPRSSELGCEIIPGSSPDQLRASRSTRVTTRVSFVGASRAGMRWYPKTGQAAKRESSLGTAERSEMRPVEYTEETHSRVQGEGSACGDPRGGHSSRA